jgi:YHS domain-containing protein
MNMRLVAAALLFAAAPVLAHEGKHAEPAGHAKKGAHADAPRSFDKQPPEGTWARCAVSGDVFKVSKDTQFATHEGRIYAFCCPDCKPDFVKNPAKFADKKSS